jgi:hypothetical protein
VAAECTVIVDVFVSITGMVVTSLNRCGA